MAVCHRMQAVRHITMFIQRLSCFFRASVLADKKCLGIWGRRHGKRSGKTVRGVAVRRMDPASACFFRFVSFLFRTEKRKSCPAASSSQPSIMEKFISSLKNMKFLIPYLRRLQFRWVVIANAVLLLPAQLYQFYLQQQPADEERIAVIIRILQSNNSSMFWYLIAGIGFYLWYRRKEKQAGYTGQFMGSFWIPLSVWVLGMVITTVMTLKSLAVWF